MEEPCQNWFSDMEIQDDVLLINQHHKIDHSLIDEDHIFREIIMHQPSSAFSNSDDTELSHSPTNQKCGDCNNNNNNLMINNSNSSNINSFNVFSPPSQHAPQNIKPAIATSPTSFILSFGDSTVVAATRETCGRKRPFHDKVIGGGTTPPPPPSKRVAEKHDLLRENSSVAKKSRSSTETLDHIMAERKRRRELTERFIALSATIPGLKKIDKATILGEAITHVKRLQERVRELEEQSKKACIESVSFIRKSNLTTSAMISDHDCQRTNETLPTVEARVFKKDVLLRIHCKIESGILLKILAHLKNLDLSTISNSVMPFGNSTLDISIIAQMGDKFNITINDLVKNLRLALLESSDEVLQQ